MTRKILSIEVERLPDSDADASYLNQRGFEDRLRDYKRGELNFIGIRAKATVQLNGDLCQTITSGGLWGIEDDSDEDYLKQIAEEEITQLRKELEAMGFSQQSIRAALAA